MKFPEVKRLDLFIITETLKLTSACLDMCGGASDREGTALLPVKPTLVCLDLNQGCQSTGIAKQMLFCP